jgi:hypothetical protein
MYSSINKSQQTNRRFTMAKTTKNLNEMTDDEISYDNVKNILKQVDDLVWGVEMTGAMSPAYYKMLVQIRKHVAMKVAAEESEMIANRMLKTFEEAAE